MQPLPSIPSRAELVPIAEEYVDAYLNVIEGIVASVDPSTATFESVLLPVARVSGEYAGRLAVSEALRYAAPEKETQEEVQAAYKVREKMYQQLGQRQDYFLLLQAVRDRKAPLDDESQHLLDDVIKDYTAKGYGILDDAQLKERSALNVRIDDHCNQYNANLRQLDPEANGLDFTEKELAGVKDISKFTVQADGRRRVPLNRTHAATIKREAHSEDVRKRVTEAMIQQLPENVPIFREIIELRDKKAKLLKHENHCEFKLQWRMVESVDWAARLIDDLKGPILKERKRLHDEQLAKKKQMLAADDTFDNNKLGAVKLEAWDRAYYHEILEREKENVDQSEVMEYFPFFHTFNFMLSLFSKYFQLRYEEVPQEKLQGHVWAPEVRVWAVWDERPDHKEEHIGYLYADMLGRPNKYKGNQAVNLQPSYVKPDGQRVLPATTIMCNFSLDERHGCLLMRHNQVVALFHELGHCMHDLLARTQYTRFHGYAVCLEFGEAISTMLENWCWIKDDLRDIAIHYTATDPKYMEAWKASNPDTALPSAEISDALLDGIRADYAQSKMTLYTSIMWYSQYDLAIHSPSSPEALTSLDESKLFVDLEEEFYFSRSPEPCHMQTDFAHLVSGYDGGYYVYLCANVFAQDMFHANFAADHRSVAAWDRYRRIMLQPGGSRDETKVLREFLGREPSKNALLKSIGLDAE